MATYLIVNCLFLLVVVAILKWRLKKFPKGAAAVILVLLVLTAIFDSLIVGLDIVGYDLAKILGIYIGKAPIEDFFYALLAGVMVPCVWHIIGKRYEKSV